MTAVKAVGGCALVLFAAHFAAGLCFLARDLARELRERGERRRAAVVRGWALDHAGIRGRRWTS